MPDVLGRAAVTAPVTAPLLEVRGLVKDFPGQRALDGVDFEVRRGEIHALLGENGAGKSTLIKCISGVHSPNGGEILVDGRAVQIRSTRDAQALGVSVIHQQSNLVPGLSVSDNLAMGGGVHHPGFLVRPRAEARAHRELLRKVGLDLDPRRLVGSLRPHEAAMVAVAKALHANAKLVILDEPTTALSAEEIDVLFDQVRTLAERGVSFVYVSHRLGEVFRLADRVTVLRNGRRIGTWERLAGHESEIVSALVGDESTLHHRGDRRSHVGTAEVLTVRGLAAGPVRSIDFSVRAGEVLGLASLAGGGADEVASALAADPPPRAGEVRIAGHPVSLRNPRRAIRAGIAMVPKDRHRQALLPGYSVRENTTLVSSGRFLTDPVVRWIRRRHERRATRSIVDALHVKASGIEQDVSTLSGGNQQKIVIGRWLLDEYRVYVFVDPSAGVDIGAKSEIYRLIQERAENGAAVVFTSSEAEEYERVCDRVLVLYEGSVVAELTGDEITESEIVRHSLNAAALPTGSKDQVR